MDPKERKDMDDAAKVVEVVLDETGAISKFVIEQEDHSISQVDASPPGIGDRIYLTPKSDSLAVSVSGLTPVAWDLIDAEGFPTVGDSISLDENGAVVVKAGVYASHVVLQVDASTIDFAETLYDLGLDLGDTFGGSAPLHLNIDGAGRYASCAVTAWYTAGFGPKVQLSVAAAANLVLYNTFLHVVRIA